MTSAQVVETSVNVISNSPSQDYTHPDDRTLLYDMTPGFKPFTIVYLPWPAKREGRGGANCPTNAQIRARNCTTSRASTRHLTLSENLYVG